MDKEPELEHSPFSKKLERNGKIVSVEIYRIVDDTSWQLEVVDEFNNSTVWNEPFENDEKALEEVEKTISSEGIESLIGEPSNSIH